MNTKNKKKVGGIAVKELSRKTSSWWVVLAREHLASKDFYADKLCAINNRPYRKKSKGHSVLWDHEARTQYVFVVESASVSVYTPTHWSSVAKSEIYKWLSAENIWGLKVWTSEGLEDSNLTYLLIFRVGEKIVLVVTGRMRKKRRGQKRRHSRWILVWDGKTIYANYVSD